MPSRESNLDLPMTILSQADEKAVLHKGTVVFLVLVAALLLSTHYWPGYTSLKFPNK
jgi:hypothetical protein